MPQLPRLSRLALAATFAALAGVQLTAARTAPEPTLDAPRSPAAATSPSQDRVERLATAEPRLKVKGLRPEVLEMALRAARVARAEGVTQSPILTVIDYSLPSTEERLWVLDTARRKVLYRELVAHGSNTGENYARHFSNTLESRQTSLGLFKTADTYIGKNGYSLRLHGLEKGVNDLALPRTIVMHGAPYVSRDFVRAHGRLGRSWGCPAVRQEVARPLIDTVKGGSLLFAYYPEKSWLASSRFLQDGGGDVAMDSVVTVR